MSWKHAIRKLNTAQVMGQLRHLVNTLGAALAMHGVVQDLAWQTYSGFGLAILAFAGSLTAKEKRQ